MHLTAATALALVLALSRVCAAFMACYRLNQCMYANRIHVPYLPHHQLLPNSCPRKVCMLSSFASRGQLRRFPSSFLHTQPFLPILPSTLPIMYYRVYVGASLVLSCPVLSCLVFFIIIFVPEIPFLSWN
ncbi:hypothetical protein F4810DRAFT_689367 [Camillea tinctor]|nr:hypothetical protein F4810DRAFT_689367 [Camillea tinctor]